MRNIVMGICMLSLGLVNTAFAQDEPGTKAPAVVQSQPVPEQAVPAQPAAEPKAAELPESKPAPAAAPVSVEKAAPAKPAPVAKAKPEATPEIVVTATKTKQEARKTPTKVEVVKGKQIQEKNVATLDQALEAAPGVITTRNDGPTGLTQQGAFSSGVALRGFSAKQTMVLLDGQPLNNYESNPQWWSLQAGTVDRIEVVKGPFSTLYGGWGIGGVVNIISKTEYAPLEFSLSKGSYDYDGLSVASGFHIKDVAYHIAYDQRSVGPVPQDYITTSSSYAGGQQISRASGGTARIIGSQSWSTEVTNFEVGANWDITTDSALGLKIINSTFEQEPEGGTALPGVTVTSGGSTTAVTDADITNSEFTREHSSRIYNLTYENRMLSKVEFSANFGVVDNYRDYYLGRVSPSTGESNRPNSRYSAGGQANITLPFNNTLTTGVDASQYRIDSADYFFLSAPQMARGKMRTIGAFVQDQWKAADFLIIYGGARYDYWRAFDAENNSPTGDAVPSNNDTHLSPKLSAVILPDTKTTIRLSAGDAFRSPALWDLYAFSYYPGNTTRSRNRPNPELKPETARCYEAGLERRLTDRVTVGATYFSNQIDDMIYKIDIPGTANPKETQYRNIAEAYTKGYELTVNYRVSDAMTVFANQTCTKTKITDVDDPTLAASIEGKEFKETPEYIYNFGANFKQDAFFADLLVRYVGDQYYNENNSDVIDDSYEGYDPYTTINITVGYNFLKNCSVSASVFNAADVEYWEGTYQNPGRTYVVKGTLTF